MVPKSALGSLPLSYEETVLGTPPSLAVRGGYRQFRGPYGRHAYETPHSFVVHRDTVDPRADAIGHLVTDAPEWGVALLAAGVVGLTAGRASYERSVQRGVSRDEANRDALIDGLVGGALAGVAAYGVARILKAVFGEN